MAKPAAKPREQIIEEFCQRLVKGSYVAAICRQADMPDKVTIWRWCKADPALAARIEEAAQEGYNQRAERVVAAAKSAKDPVKGRLAFDAERWLLGKISNRFADKPVVIDARTLVAGGDAFAPIAEALDRAAAALAGSGHATRLVDASGPARPVDPAG